MRVNETEARGFVRGDVKVPAEEDVAVSAPFFIEDAGKWVMVKGATHDPAHASYPFEIDGQPFIPRASVKVSGELPHRFVVFVQNATPDEMTLDTTPKAKMITQLRSANGSKFILDLEGPIANVSTLNVTMRKKGSSDERTSSFPLLP